MQDKLHRRPELAIEEDKEAEPLLEPCNFTS